jgi:hypothetical protein
VPRLLDDVAPVAVAFRNRPGLWCGDLVIPVRIALSGHVDPLDGHYHWGGRVDPDVRVVGLLRDGKRDVTVQVGDLAPLPARLTEADPWGGVLVAATGKPPWEAPELSTEDTPQEA